VIENWKLAEGVSRQMFFAAVRTGERVVDLDQFILDRFFS